MITLVAGHARHRPDAIAVRQWDETLTYRDLCAASGGLAEKLRARGAGPEVLMGLCADRRPSMIVGLLGILASGAGYVPLDPTLPVARIRDIITEAGLRTVVCDPTGARLLADAGLDLVVLPAAPTPHVDHSSRSMPQKRHMWHPPAPRSVAYVMFTSGSTGRPKGVVIEHASLTEFVESMAEIAGLDSACRSLGFASIGFDASVIDILTPLAAGGTVALASEQDRADPVRLQRFCVEHGVSVAFIPPAVLPLLDPDSLPELRVVLTGSEAPGPEQVRRWTGDGRRFFNLYGPTELTVLVTWYEASGHWDRPLPIGAPAAKHRASIVDGELLAGGPGLARGYLGDPARTAERFVPDPAVPGERLYRTGDLVRRLPDGTLEFLGRADRQVKVRGQRVELGEVEAVLRAHPDVGHAAVAALSDGLVAFVTSTVDEHVLREHCAHRLPAAMVPGRVHIVPELPLTASGKVDLDALFATATATQSQGVGVFKTHKPPGLWVLKTPEEERLAELWAELLGECTGPEADFVQSGGHSISAMRLVAAIRERLGREVAIEDVLEGRTLRTIAARVSAADPVPDGAPVRGRPPALSPSQQRLWFLDHYSPDAAAAYNIAIAERLRGPLDVPALRAALTAVAERHEVLRWRIQELDGLPHAVVDPPAPVPLVVEDVSRQSPEELAARLAAAATERFALATDTLWRARVFRLGTEDHVLAVTAHHAVFDGWSQSLLYHDLAAAYAGHPLPALPATYGDYVAWRAERQRKRAEQDLAWWVSHLDDVPTVLELPTDHPRPAEQTFAGGHAGITLDVDTTTALTRLATRLGATPSAILLASLSVVLARLTGQPDLVIGSPMVDRRAADFEDMIGFFIEIAPLRLCPKQNVTFAEHVKASGDELLAALAHPEAPLEAIVHALGLGGRFDRGPLVQVLFNMFNFAEPRLELPELTSEPVPVGTPGSPFDLTLYGIERDGRLRVEVVYNTDLFGRSRMIALLEAVREVVVQGVANPGIPIGKLIPGVSGPATPVTVPRARPRVRATTPSEPPATPTELAIAGVWGEVLGRGAVGASENFFDAGGTSLSIVAVQRRLNLLLGKELRVVDLFRNPTVGALAAHLDGTAAGVDAAVERAAARGAARRDRGRQRRGVR